MIKMDEKSKYWHGKCIVCEKEEKYMTNLVLFPSGNFAHFTCYPVQIVIN